MAKPLCEFCDIPLKDSDDSNYYECEDCRNKFNKQTYDFAGHEND